MNSGAKVYLGSTYASIQGSTKISEPTWDNEAKKFMWNGHPIFKYGFVDHLNKDDDNEGILESETDDQEDKDGIPDFLEQKELSKKQRNYRKSRKSWALMDKSLIE